MTIFLNRIVCKITDPFLGLLGWLLFDARGFRGLEGWLKFPR